MPISERKEISFQTSLSPPPPNFVSLWLQAIIFLVPEEPWLTTLKYIKLKEENKYRKTVQTETYIICPSPENLSFVNYEFDENFVHICYLEFLSTLIQTLSWRFLFLNYFKEYFSIKSKQEENKYQCEKLFRSTNISNEIKRGKII